MVVDEPPTILESKDDVEAINVRHSISNMTAVVVDLQLMTKMLIRKSDCRCVMSPDKTLDITTWYRIDILEVIYACIHSSAVNHSYTISSKCYGNIWTTQEDSRARTRLEVDAGAKSPNCMQLRTIRGKLIICDRVQSRSLRNNNLTTEILHGESERVLPPCTQTSPRVNSL